jgi:hypothetical protein
MRWVNSVAVLALAATSLAAGCGNYSTEDIRFLSALPRRADLHLAVPVQSAPPTGALVSRALVSAACPGIGDATVWQWAKPTSDDLNKAVDWVIGLVDAVRRYPPTERRDDWRRWGPFDDDKHPRRELRIDITRTYPELLAGEPRYAYTFEARVKGDGTFIPLIAGEFDGDSSAHGNGWVELRFDNFRLLQMNDATTPDGTMRIQYDRVSDPRTTDLTLATAGFGVVKFGYGYAGYADGRGAFDYAFRELNGDLLEVATSYDAAGAGRLRVTFTAAPPSIATGSFNQCFDAAGCLVYVDDPYNFTQSCGVGPGPCLTGDLGVCATVPVFVF